MNKPNIEWTYDCFPDTPRPHRLLTRIDPSTIQDLHVINWAKINFGKEFAPSRPFAVWSFHWYISSSGWGPHSIFDVRFATVDLAILMKLRFGAEQ